MTRFLTHCFRILNPQTRRFIARYWIQVLLSLFVVFSMAIQTQNSTESNFKSEQTTSLSSSISMVQTSPSQTQSDSSSDLLFEDDFEAGIADEWIYERPHPSTVQVVDAPGRSGKAVKFDLRRGEGERAEIRLEREPAGADRWYGFQTLLPDSWEADRSFEMIAQWHGWPDFDQGETWRTPPLSLIVEGDRIKIHNRWDPKPVTQNNDPAPEGGTETIWQGNYVKGEWSDWVFRVKWSYQSDGLIQVWRDGEKIVDRRGPNTYNDESGIYFKTGLYKPHWKYENSDTSTTTRRTLYVDNVRIGDRQLPQNLSADAALPSQPKTLNRNAVVADDGAESSMDDRSVLSESTRSQPNQSPSDQSLSELTSAPPRIALNDLQSHGGANQDQQAQLSISNGGYAAKLTGNGWKNQTINYNVTPETVLTFEFRSSSTGEIHAIGFDTNRRVTSSDASQTFKLSGTQDWGNSQFDDYVTGSGWKSYQIPVGQYFTGEMTYLTLVNDHDVESPLASSEFKNIRLFDQPSHGGSLHPNGDRGMVAEWQLQSDALTAIAGAEVG